MCDLPRILLYDPTENDDPAPDIISRPTTPLPGAIRTLRSTMSYASLDTVVPPKGKGVRRHITDMAESLKHKSAKKKKRTLALDNTPEDLPLGAMASSGSKASRGRRKMKAATPLRNSPQRFDEEGSETTTDRLHSGVPSQHDVPLMFLGDVSDSLADQQPPKLIEKGCEDSSFCMVDVLEPSRVPRVDIKDVQLDVQPSEANVTIWDGLRAEHLVFQCQVFLRCTAHSYDSVTLPNFHCFKMDCHTHPPRSLRHVKPPVLQSSYKGASPRWDGDNFKVDLKGGIHMDRFWHTKLNADGTWGWSRKVFVPLSTRLFDKMEYREFKLVSRMSVGTTCIEGELTFGISMLLRGVDMR